MNEWKIIESLPNKIVTQEDLRIKGSWIAPLLLVLPGLVPIWLGIPILPATIVCQPVSDLDATNSSYAKLRANQVCDRLWRGVAYRLRQFLNFPAV